MTKHKVGTKFTREYNGKKVTVKVTKNGYQYGTKTFRSLSAAVKEGVGTSTPASVFFKIGGKAAAKSAKKTRKGKAAQIEMAPSPIQLMVKRMVQEEMQSIREEVRTAVSGALKDEFRSEFDSH